MASAPEAFGNVGDIQFSFAAKADAVTSVRKLPEKRGDLDILNSQSIVHQAFTIFFFGLALFHLLLRYRDPGELLIAMQIGEGGAQQAHLRGGVCEINVARALRRISTREHEFARQRKSTLVRSLEHKRSRIGEQRGVDTSEDLRCDLHTGLSRQ